MRFLKLTVLAFCLLLTVGWVVYAPIGSASSIQVYAAGGCTILQTKLSADGNNLQVVTPAPDSGNPTNNITSVHLTGGSMSPMVAGSASIDTASGNNVYTFTGITSLKTSQPPFTVTAYEGSNGCATADVTSLISASGSPPTPVPPASTPTLGPGPTIDPVQQCVKDHGWSTDVCKNWITCQNSKDSGSVWVTAFGNQCVTFTSFFSDLFGYITMFAAIIAGFVFLVGAYNYLGSRGDPSKLAEGREMITNAIIGLILIGTAFAIIKFLNGAFQAVDPGINLLGPFGGG